MAVAKPAVDITLLGDKSLERMLAALPRVSQKKAVRPALRACAKRLKADLLANISGPIIEIRTGRYRSAMVAERVHALKRIRGLIGVAFDMPTRVALGISPEDKHYYPFALEYGDSRRGLPPKAPIRRTVDEHKDVELRRIGTAVGKDIEKQARKLGKNL